MSDLFARLQAGLTDRYTLERELGRGGMATVYLARDLRHRRPVALKVLHPELARALGADRFLREIEVAANLTHPHILPLFDSGEVDSLLYYVMPYIDGESLRERLRRETQLGVGDALELTREVADALAYAHRQGIIHRDIKPENILLHGGHALVADFGIARALWQAEGERLTETGMAVGTPAYMSPEQATGERQVDGRSDVYSLGCVLYEMLAGEPPYTGPTVRAITVKRLNDPVPSIRRLRPTVPPAIERALSQALAPVPADRLATAEQFAQALADRAAPPAETGRRPAAMRRLAAPVLLAVLLVIAAVAFVVGRNGPGPAADPPGDLKTLAVLPFENLGDTADAYFADGVTDAVRGKLAALSGLQVIARGSSNQYRNSAKTPQEIGRELGVDYLLTATVRWVKTGGTSRVQVTPELVQAASASTRWQEPFGASLDDVFQVQSDIADRVAQALDVALNESARRQLAEPPTRNLAAYDAYLKGQELMPTSFFGEPANTRQAMVYYSRAVALDTAFVQAWTELSLAYSSLYYISTPTPAGAEQALRAAQRARQLAPDRAEGHLALGFYYLTVLKDPGRAAAEFKEGQLKSPGSADLHLARAFAAQRLGLDTALTHLQRAQVLDPRSVSTAEQLALTLLLLRRYPEAQRAAERTLALAPSHLPAIEEMAMIQLAQGDLEAARAVLARSTGALDSTTVVAYFAVYWDLYWMLTDAQQRLLLRLPASAFDGDRTAWGLALAATYAQRGDQARARAYADSARVSVTEQLQATPEDGLLRMLHGLSLAYLGRKDEAIEEGRRGVALEPIATDAFGGSYIQHQLVRIYILVGEHEKALDQLEPLLEIPYFLSPGWLRIDPTFDPLRGHPRFERLLRETTTALAP
jgi:serine/threonine-protein kinase